MKKRMRIAAWGFGLFLAVATQLPLHANEAESALFAAARAGDSGRIVLALSEVKPDVRDADGRTALMIAAENGHFEAARRLLWGGADATLKSSDGRIARDFLDPANDAFAPLSLILRCHAFTREYGREGGRARIPHLAMINDNWVDPHHPKLKPFYQVNEAELNGKPGVDDDGNGFIDDVYGWNFMNDQPLAPPQLLMDDSEKTRHFLKKLVDDYLVAAKGDKTVQSRLEGSYDNPLIHQIGFGVLSGGGIDLNDYVYAGMFYQASHGTHVAGIISEYSERKARLIGTAISARTPPTPGAFFDTGWIIETARNAPDYTTFIVNVMDRYRGEAIAKGRRASDYLRSTGAGVANMSWGRPRKFFEGRAGLLELLYRLHGKNVASISAPPPPQHELLMANLPLEMIIADAASFALVFHENPDVLVVIAAGNEAENNDETLNSPQYLSRFFPNVITVASVGVQNQPSKFTNRGVRSVQIAAPGEDIVATILGGLEAPMTGTSMAAPIVAGVAAGIRADHPQLTATDMRRLLETSIVRSDALQTVCSSCGYLDIAAARTLARSWSGDNLAMLVDEARRAQTQTPEEAKLNIPSLATRDVPPPQPEAPKREGPKLRMTAVSGVDNQWRVVMSAGTPFSGQMHLGTGPWPEEKVVKAWNDGYRITAMGGTMNAWNIVMSTGVKGLQRVDGYDFNQTRIAAAMKEGYRITSLAGNGEQWLIALDTETGYGDQRFTLPTPLTDARRQWVLDRWDEGYRITALAGDDDPANDNDGWLFVMSKNSGLGEQGYAGPGPWPTAWVDSHLRNGYRITSIAGPPERTIVVMTKGTKLTDQEVSPGGFYPSGWILERW